MQKHVSDSESVNMGNLENREEWLEQVEEAAKIDIPLWEDWDRGQRMLQAMIPCETSCSIMVSDREAYYPDWDKVEEPELATARRMLDASISDLFSESTLSDEAKLDRFSFSTLDVAEQDTDHFRIIGAAGSVSPVGACAGTGTKSICMLEHRSDGFWQDIETVDLMDNLFSLTDDYCRSRSATPKTTGTRLLSAEDTKTAVLNKSLYSNTSLLEDDFNLSPCHSNGKRNSLENGDLHRGKFVHNHLVFTSG